MSRTYSKNNIHKKATFEDRFNRKFACWVENNPKAWHYWKVRNRRQFRRIQNRCLKKEFTNHGQVKTI